MRNLKSFSCLVLLPFLFTSWALALDESKVQSTVKPLIEKGNPCDDGKDFWTVKKAGSSLQSFSRPMGNLKLFINHLPELLQNPDKSEVLDQIIHGILTKDNFDFVLVSQPVENQKEYGARYSRFGCSSDIKKPGYKGALVIGPGRSEGSVEYYETAMDFVAMGYSPVYVIDHRGQGFSPRLPSNPQVGHVVNFYHYIDDMAQIVEDVQGDLLSFFNTDERPKMYYTSNSMGGAIGMGYFMYHAEKNPFEKAALLGAMVKFNSLSFIGKEPTEFNNVLYSEEGAMLQALFSCTLDGKIKLDFLGGCDEYARPEQFGDFVLEKRIFLANDENMMTHSEERFGMRTWLWGNDLDWSEKVKQFFETQAVYGSDENWVGPQVGGASFNWVLASNNFLRNEMRTAEAVQKLGPMKVKYITGSRDLRGYYPYFDEEGNLKTSMKHFEEFCSLINSENKMGDSGLCEFEAIEGGFHELYKESDEYRTQALEKVDAFFQKP